MHAYLLLPTSAETADTDVPVEGYHLRGKRIALVVSGGIAAVKVPFVARALRRQSARVTVVVTREALRFVTPDALEWCSNEPVIADLSASVDHVSDRDPFDAFLVAPATGNLIDKLARGVADDAASTLLAAALRGGALVLIAPSMTGTPPNDIMTRSMATLAGLGVRFIDPRAQDGKHSLLSRDRLVAETCRAVTESPLRGKRILVTGGPTPVPIDDTRRITNRFRGRLGMRIARELHLRGAIVTLIQGDSAFGEKPDYPVVVARTFQEYRDSVLAELEVGHDAAVFSAGVADYTPREVVSGKIPSGMDDLTIAVSPTPKVIEEVRTRYPGLYMVTFKYQPGVTVEGLHEIARSRLAMYDAVVANRDTDMSTDGRHRAWLVDEAGSAEFDGKDGIALGIADHLTSSRICTG